MGERKLMVRQLRRAYERRDSACADLVAVAQDVFPVGTLVKWRHGDQVRVGWVCEVGGGPRGADVWVEGEMGSTYRVDVWRIMRFYETDHAILRDRRRR